MAATPIVYVFCDNNCKYEGMTKEQILTAIAQAVSSGKIVDVDTGFITTVKTINGTPLRFFVGTQNEYEALSEADKENLFAIITNDTNKEGIEKAIKALEDWKNDVTIGKQAIPNASGVSLALSNTIEINNDNKYYKFEKGFYMFSVFTQPTSITESQEVNHSPLIALGLTNKRTGKTRVLFECKAGADEIIKIEESTAGDVSVWLYNGAGQVHNSPPPTIYTLQVHRVFTIA